MSSYKITTDLSVKLVATAYAASHDLELELTFTVNTGQPQTYYQPGEAASVEVLTATVIERNGTVVSRHKAPSWIWRMIEGDDALEAEMLAEAWESDEAGRDYRAEAMREERLLERRA